MTTDTETLNPNVRLLVELGNNVGGIKVGGPDGTTVREAWQKSVMRYRDAQNAAGEGAAGRRP
ncbi:MAG: hypothetical protein RSD49_04760 [Hafnia sp.]